MDKKRNKKQVNSYMGTSKGKKIAFAALAVAIAAVSFVSGMGAVWFSLDKGIRTLIEVKSTIEDKYYLEMDDETFYQGVFDGVNGVLDPYSEYMTVDEYAQSANSLNGKRIGVGLSFSNASIEEGKLKISRVAGNSPAEEGGMVAGSYLIGFGRTEETLMQSQSYDEFSTFLESMAESVPFLLQSEMNGETSLHTVARKEYVENYVFYRSSRTAYAFVGENATTLTERGSPLAALPEDTAYIRLVRFGGAAVEVFEGGMSLFKQENKKNLILDLRGNGGGYLHTMQGIASYFCKGATENYPIAAIADYGDHEEYYRAKGNYYQEYFGADSRVCILADSGSASAAECLIGVLIDYGVSSYADVCLFERDGVIKTYGKGIMQSYFNIGLAGGVVKLTTAQMRWPVTGYSIHTRGVLPEDGTKTVKQGVNDEVELIEAIELLFGE